MKITCTILITGLMLAACFPIGIATEEQLQGDESRKNPSQTGKAVEAERLETITPSPDPTLVTGSTNIPGQKSVPTPEVKPPVNKQHHEATDVIPLFNIQPRVGGTPPDATSTYHYLDLVNAVVIKDLSARLVVEEDEVFLVNSGYQETQIMAPCGIYIEDEEAGSFGEGITLGFEVLLKVGSKVYRYIAIGGLAHYCGIQ